MRSFTCTCFPKFTFRSCPCWPIHNWYPFGGSCLFQGNVIAEGSLIHWTVDLDLLVLWRYSIYIKIELFLGAAEATLRIYRTLVQDMSTIPLLSWKHDLEIRFSCFNCHLIGLWSCLKKWLLSLRYTTCLKYNHVSNNWMNWMGDS